MEGGGHSNISYNQEQGDTDAEVAISKTSSDPVDADLEDALGVRFPSDVSPACTNDSDVVDRSVE